MLVIIPSVLGPRDLETVNQLFEQADFVDGKFSAGSAAELVKDNEEMDQKSDIYKQLNKLVLNNLMRHPLFKNAALANKIASPFYARYTTGKQYGDHIDDPVMGAPHYFRTDVSTTVFLNGPEAYDGGELVVRTTYGEKVMKLPAGHAVVYPSHSLHHVNEVLSGERRVMVTWIQSMIRSAERREVLFGINSVREKMLRKAPTDEDTKKLDIAYANLFRMWAEV
jgi:PKHD-type hydroxylase